MGRTNICETNLKSKQDLYLAIDDRERFKEALNQIVFFNLSILIIFKITWGWRHIWHDSRFLVCCYAEYNTTAVNFMKIFRTNKSFKAFLPSASVYFN